MKNLLTVLLGLALAASVHAADGENSNSATVDQSKNPLTGTRTTTKKWNHKTKNANGKTERATTETTKEMTDGSSERKTETDTKSDTN